MSTNLIPLALNSFVASGTVNSDIYIRLNGGKYIKILKEGQIFERRRVERYEGHEIDTVFMPLESLRNYNQKGLSICRALSNQRGLIPVDYLKVVCKVCEGILNEVFYGEMTEKGVEAAEDASNYLLHTCSQITETKDLFKSVLGMGSSFARHSVLTSLLAIYLAKLMKWRGERQLRSIALAALLHDIGFRDIPGDLYLKCPSKMNESELKNYHSHPQVSVKILSKYKSATPEALSAIADHHELPNGKGFPQGLTTGKIFPLSRLIMVSDFLANQTINGPKNPNPKPLAAAITHFLNLHGDQLRDEYVSALNVLKKSQEFKS